MAGSRPSDAAPDHRLGGCRSAGADRPTGAAVRRHESRLPLTKGDSAVAKSTNRTGKGNRLPNDEYQRFDQILGRAIRKSRNRARFDAQCREAMKDKSRDEAREILIEHYGRIGEQPPGQPLLDRKLDMLIAPVTAATRVSDILDSVSALAGMTAHVKKIFQAPTHDDMAKLRKADVFAKPNWNRTCRVDLDDGAQSKLDETGAAASVSFRDMSGIAVTIRAAAPRADGGELEVLVGEVRVGAIADSDSDPYWDVIEDDPQPDTTIATQALRTRESNADWRLDLGAPERIIRRPRFEDFSPDSPDE